MAVCLKHQVEDEKEDAGFLLLGSISTDTGEQRIHVTHMHYEPGGGREGGEGKGGGGGGYRKSQEASSMADAPRRHTITAPM